MREDLKDLMYEVASDRLKYVQEHEPGEDNVEAAFKQGMAAFNAYNEVAKADEDREERLKNEESKAKEGRFDKVVKVFEVVVVPVGMAGVGYICNKKLAEFLCKAEQFESFTSTAGRSLGKMFKFK